MKTYLKILAALLFLAVSTAEAGCGDRNPPTAWKDAGVSDASPVPANFPHSSTGMQLSPQGGTITGATTGGGLLSAGGKLGLLTSCGSGQTMQYAGSGSGWICGTGGISNSAGSNFVVKSSGVGSGVVASTITDDGTVVTATAGKLVVSGSSASTTIGNDVVEARIANTTGLNNVWETLSFYSGGAIGAGIDVQNIDFTNHYADINFSTRFSGGYGSRMKIASNGDVSIGGTNFQVLAASGTGVFGQAMDVAGATTLDGSVALGNAAADPISFIGSAATPLDMNSHKILDLTNGTNPQDAAAFGQIASAVSGAVVGTTNTIPIFTSANAIGNSTTTYDATNGYAAIVPAASGAYEVVPAGAGSGTVGRFQLGGIRTDQTSPFRALQIKPVMGAGYTSGMSIDTYEATGSTISQNIMSVAPLTLATTFPNAMTFSSNATFTPGAGQSVIVAADATNGRSVTFADHAQSAQYAITFPGANVSRYRYLTGGVDAWQVDSSGNFEAYQVVHMDSNVVMNQGQVTVGSFASTQISPAAITGATNDWAPTGLATATTILVTSSSSTILLNGLTGGVNGRRIVIVNADASQSLFIRNENAGSVAANRIVTAYGDDVLLGAGLGSNVTLEYWASRWHVVSINTFTPPGMTFQGQVIVGASSITLANNGNIVTSGGTIEGAILTTPSLGIYASGGSLGFAYGTSGTVIGHINDIGTSGGTTDFRGLEIDDGKGSGTGHYIASFDGPTRTVTLANQFIFTGRQSFTSAGSSTYTPTAGTRYVHFRICGGGGGAGGAKSAASGGGAGGAYVEGWTGNSTAMTGGTAVVGAAGAAGTSTPGNGGTGGDSSIVLLGTTYTAKGGLGSVLASSAATMGAAGQSGSTVADINMQGEPGTIGFGTTTLTSGNGGSSPFGAGAVGVKVTSGVTNGINGTGACSGGGGGADIAGTGATGGSGTVGKIFIEEYQ